MTLDDNEHPDGRLRFRLKTGESRLLVVVFSQVRVPEDKFGLERLFARTRHHCLFLNDTKDGWYLGLADQIDAAVHQAASATAARRIVYYGSSMGGFGALTTGLRRGDGSVHAFGPELRPGRPGSQSRQYGVQPDDPGLPDIAEPSGGPCHPVHLYFGICDPVDAAQVAPALNFLPGAQCHLLRSSHASHDHLYSLNIIRRIIMTFARNPATELISKGLLATPDLDALERFGVLAETLANGDPVDPVLPSQLAGYAGNPGMMWLRADALVRQGALEEAFDVLLEAETLINGDDVLKTLPKRWRKIFPLRRVELLVQCGKRQAARNLLDETSKQFPLDSRMIQQAEELAASAS